MLLPTLRDPPGGIAVRFPDGALEHRALAASAAALAAQLPATGPIAVWATPSLATVVALTGALAAGATAVPINPQSGFDELRHVVSDARPTAVLAAPDVALPAALDALRRIDPFATQRSGDRAAAGAPPAEPPPDRAALILYTSGTTGQPKGVVLDRGALAANLDALAAAWSWSASDVVVQALPLYHVHGLVIGVLGPLRRGGSVVHLGRFDVAGIANALHRDGTMLFGVPTMYHRLAPAAEADPEVAAALRGARMLVSGSAALAAPLHTRLERATGQHVVERYGMSETLMITSVRPGERRPGYVGRPLPGVVVRVCDDAGSPVPRDDETVGGVWVRSPSLFRAYLGRPDATAAAFRDGWFETGDLGCLAADGTLRLVGRRSTDLIKSGGYRIGAGEIEASLLDHPGVDEAAVLGLPDEDLGERIVAWVVAACAPPPSEQALIQHVATALSPSKRPREIRYLDALPRNAMGKVQKRLLRDDV